MTVSLDWLAQINIIINTTVVQVPTFNNCMIIGLFPFGSIPSSWGGAIYKGYNSYAAINADFASKITGTTTQDNRYQWLLNAASQFFSQTPTPTTLYLAQIDPATTNYVTALNTVTTAFNNFYAFYIADQLTASQVTGANGVYAGLASLTSSNNLKVLFIDTADLGIVATDFLYDVTNGGIGNPRAILCAHTNNFVPVAGGTQAPTALGAACMGAFFTNLFTTSIGLKALGNQALTSVASDSVITAASLGTPGQGNGIIGVNGNVYPAFGSGGAGYMQYGTMASSTSDSLLYLDEVVGADYIKLTVQADLVSYILQQQPVGGVPYSDVGIQSLATVFKNSLQKGVTQNIIQQFTNTNIGIVPYSQVTSGDKAARIYQGLSANLTYLGRIQRLYVNVTLGI